MKKPADQIALPLDWPQTEGELRFIVTEANREAFDHFRHWSMWPVKATILTGPRRSGRTLLARTFAERVGGRLIDQADSRDEEELFHGWNDAQDSGLPLVMVAEEAPPAWSPKLPDLRTRLAITPVATINPPDDELFEAAHKNDLLGASEAAQLAYSADAYLGSAREILRRLYALAYDQQSWLDAAKYCSEGHRRFGDELRFVQCELWLMASPA